ncbi:hypothetical protein B1R27_30755 [Streptomyces sp. GKU 895]|nr:hypothetical protein B1R27_30755 [Streptomyces sp. GKU 895]
MFATHLTQLPAPTQQALLLAAVCDTGELGLLPAPYTDPDVWQPAADRGLVQLTGDHVQFRHPLMRSAVYHSAPAERRRAAHRDLAARPQLTPDRQAWHLAAAASGTDEQAATALEATADRALRRSASTEALTAMERAAQLSATPRTRAQRLMRTAYLATYQERAAYVSDLATRIAALTDDPDITFQLTLLRGWAAFARNRPTEAIRILLPAARALAPLDPDTARSALVTAVTAALFSGVPAHRDQVLAATAEFDTGHPDDAVTRLYAQAMCRPHHEPHRQHEELQRLLTTTKPDMRITWLLSGVAAIHDLPDPFHPVPPVLADPDHPDTENAGNRLRVSSLGWLAFHQGRIRAAQTAVTRTADTPPGEEPGLADAQVHSLAGAVLALRGQTQEARRALHDALSVDAHPTGRVNIHARWALGLAAWADQDHEEAYRHLASAFTDDGRPQHYYQSYYCLAALAAAARHTGDAARIAHARTAVDQAVQQLADASSARLTQLLHHAQALLAHPTQDAETHYKYALADPLGEQWPFERACVRTDYGHWLRHANRTQEAREQLGRALAAFERLGARPWVAQIRMP